MIHRSKIIQNKINSLKSKVQVIDDGKNFVFKIFFNECLKCKPYKTYTNLEIKEITCRINSSYTEVKKIKVNKKLNVLKSTNLNYPKNINIKIVHHLVY